MSITSNSTIAGTPRSDMVIDSFWVRNCPLARLLSLTDGMRRPVSGRDAIRSQVIDVLEAQKIKETGNEEG